MTSQSDATFLEEFPSRRTALVAKLLKAGDAGEGPKSLGDLTILTAAATDLSIWALANTPEPPRGDRIRRVIANLGTDVVHARKLLEREIPERRLDTPEGSA